MPPVTCQFAGTSYEKAFSVGSENFSNFTVEERAIAGVTDKIKENNNEKIGALTLVITQLLLALAKILSHIGATIQAFLKRVKT
jgi:hypothetical protein